MIFRKAIICSLDKFFIGCLQECNSRGLKIGKDISVVGYNDQPVQKDKGSAFFIHITTKKYAPTKGCIALNLNDMKKLLSYNPKNIKII